MARPTHEAPTREYTHTNTHKHKPKHTARPDKVRCGWCWGLNGTHKIFTTVEPNLVGEPGISEKHDMEEVPAGAGRSGAGAEGGVRASASRFEPRKSCSSEGSRLALAAAAYLKRLQRVYWLPIR
jgi:hypothetical protein